jgi:hypothetical protein
LIRLLVRFVHTCMHAKACFSLGCTGWGYITLNQMRSRSIGSRQAGEINPLLVGGVRGRLIDSSVSCMQASLHACQRLLFVRVYGLGLDSPQSNALDRQPMS